MSGGMDIDWSCREKLLRKAKEKFGNLTKEELFDKSEDINTKIESFESQINEIYKTIRHLRDDEDLIWAICKDRKYF